MTEIDLVSSNSEHTFTFKSGISVRLRRVNRRFVAKVAISAKQRFLKKNSEPQCPTYSVQTAGKDSETYDHDETTVVEKRWREDEELQTQWKEYLRLSTALRACEITESVRAIVIKGVLSEPSVEWLDDQDYFKIELASDPRDQKWEWLQDVARNFSELAELSVVIRTVEDSVEAAAQVAVESF